VLNRKLVVILAILALVLAVAACGDDEGAETTTTAAVTTTTAAEEFVVGVSWNNYNEERWAKWDEPDMKAAIEAGGGRYISTDAGSSAEQQLADVEQLIAQGADALIILAQDGTAIKPAVASALDQGIPVIAYDRLIEDARALYITFDNVEVGRMQARAVFAVAPTGNYVFIKGNSADANADFLRQGQQEVLQAALDSGAIVNVGEAYTDNWDPAVAQTNMEQFLTQNNNDAAALNRIALGTQTVSVWKDARELGKKAGEAAIALAKGTAMADLPDTVMFASPGGNQMTSYLLTPVPITIDNLQVVIDAGWITVETLCQGVTAGTVDVCG
jgi:D-xylose transport system substrate-binding protein